MKPCHIIFESISKYFIIGLIVAIYSCKNIVSPMTQKDEVEFSFPSNQSYNFDINETNEIYTEFGKKQIEATTNNIYIDLIYSTQGSNSKGHNAGVRFNKVSTLNCIQGENNENTFNPFQESLKAFDGATFNVALSPQGAVNGISGYEDFKEKIDSLYRVVAMGESANPLPSTAFEETFFKDLFNNISNILPGNSVNINSSWEREEAEEIGADKNIKCVYKCNKIQNGVVNISSLGQIVKTIRSHNTSMSLNGQVEGEYYLDANTGILTRSKRIINMSGSIKIKGIDWKMTVRKTISINGKRIGE